MNAAVLLAILIPVAYVVGTFPSAALVARANGIDIREVGSGNPGASNVMRVLGWRRGVWVFVLDALKGACMAGLGLVVDGRVGGYLLAAAAIIGHIFPVWYRFRGGKGVATGAGAFFVLAPLVSLALTAAWFVIARVTRKASAASITVITLAPIAIGLVERSWWEFFVTAFLCVLILIRHLDNIERLLNGDENTLHQRD